MKAFLEDGTYLDVALVAVAIEVLVLVLFVRRLRLGDVFGQVLAGALLLFAVRVALTGGDPLWVAALVSASLPAHVFDLLRRARAR